MNTPPRKLQLSLNSCLAASRSGVGISSVPLQPGARSPVARARAGAEGRFMGWG